MKPLPYQKQTLRRMERCGGRILLASDAGLGKTLVTLKWIHKHEAWPALVVCPAIVKLGWDHHALEVFNVRADILEGRKASQSPGLGGRRNKLCVINYDIIAGWLPHLLDLGFKTLVLDESQMIANRSIPRTKACLKLASEMENVIALSATPLLNRPSELWPTLHALWPAQYPSFWTYAQAYCAPKKTRWGWDYRGASNLPQLHKELKQRGMIRYLKQNVLDLPDKQRKIHLLPIRDRKQYREAELDFVSWMKKHKRARLSRSLKAKQLSQVGQLKILAAKLKTRAVVKWLRTWLDRPEHANEKVLVFCVHRGMVRVLLKHFLDEAVVIDGSTSHAKRKLAVKQFQQSPNIRMLIGNIQAAGTGLDGLQVASTVAFVELPWRPGDVTQAEDRAYRIGTQKKVHVYYLVAEGTIEEKLCHLIQHKQQTVSTVLDGNKRTNSLNIFDELMQEMIGGTDATTRKPRHTLSPRR